MRIGIDLNGVLRDTIGKFRQTYEKYLIDGYQDPFTEKTYELDNTGDTIANETPEPFEYKIFSEVTSLNLIDHFSFQSNEELYDFMYNDYTMEIFGHAGSVEYTSMMDLNDFYLEQRENHDIIIISDEIGKSKPATLFYLSKYGCLVETVKFYSEKTLNSIWGSIDVLLTANPKLLLEKPNDKIVIKYNTIYNSGINVDLSISTLKELNNKIIEIYDTSIR